MSDEQRADSVPLSPLRLSTNNLTDTTGRWFNRLARRLYGVTRIPALPHDWNTATPHPAVARHITVIARDNYYELEVVRKDGTLLGIDALEKALWDIVADAQKGDGAGVGVLSSDNRDTWTKVSAVISRACRARHG